VLRELERKSDIVKNFAPSWFASVMGTGILATTSSYYDHYLSFLGTVATILFWFNVGLFVVLLIPWTLRWIFFRKEALRDLQDPILSNFYATFAIAMLVLAANFMVIGKDMRVGEAFWFLAVAATVFFALVTPYIMFKGEHVKIDHINPAWFIPPVGLIVIPVAGSLVIPQFSGTMQQFVLFLNYFGWGAGFFLYLALSAVCMYRFILHKPLPNTLVATMWVTLGPIGVGVLALINLVKNSPFATVKEPFLVVGFLLWGSGIWWVLMSLLITLHYLTKLKLPYAMSWWAFTFPLGAYVAASHVISKSLNLPLIDYIGFGLFWLLVFFWTITLARTVVGVGQGTLFRSPPSGLAVEMSK
jgi:C4-dicarboxylate transporter/malic acid transport protein